MTTDDDPTPDWDLWRSLPTVSLFEATALSMNVDPRYLRPHVPGYRGGGILIQGIPPDGFHDRLALAQRCVGETLPAAMPRDGEPHVRLGQFGTWAAALGWSLPPEFAASACSAGKATATSSGSADLQTAVSGAISELGRPGRDIG